MIFKEVDLGLSILWADRNVGCNNPESFGLHYSWGDLDTWGCDSYYSLWNLDCKRKCISGNSTYDIAAKDSKGLWRLPTANEVDELISKCRFEMINEDYDNGIPAGFRVYGPNNNSIFLPLSGYGEGSVPEESYVDHHNKYGCYWSGTICENQQLAYVLFLSRYETTSGLNKEWRSHGCSIRPVKNK